MTFQLIYWGTYKQIHLKINLPVYCHASLSSNHKDLPVTTTTCVHVHRCTRSEHYAFIFILSLRLTAMIYPSTVLLFYMSTDVPVHQYTCSVYFKLFCISYAMTFQLIYWGTYPQIHPKINLPVYPHASLSSNHKGPTCHHNYLCTCPYLYPFMALPVDFHTFIPINRLDLPVNVSTALHVHRCTCSSVYLFSLFLLFRHNMHNELSAHLWVPTHSSTRK